MAHQSLYRTHRPQTFGDLVGQEHVCAALRNAVRDDRVGHAYLFSGPRGTGKTSTARILAKACNCLDLGADGEPCGACENCVAIAEGRFLDLFELDAASNNSVDNIRDLTDSVHLGLGPTARTKVYLIDEVHMLSAAASNALLKTLEEPPAHVVFVLATTNPEKVLPTIRSRTQHFEFTLLTTEELAGHLATVTEREGVAGEPAALDAIAKAAGGSARDALSLLDQALAHGGERLTASDAAALFGTTDLDRRAAVLDAIAGGDPTGALLVAQEILGGGHDPRRVAEDLLRTARDAFLLATAGARAHVDATDAERERLAAVGDALGPGLAVRVVETLGETISDIRGTDAADPRLLLEVAVVRLARRDAGPPLQALADRVERLERAISAGGAEDSVRKDRPGGDTTPAEPSSPTSRGRGKALGALRKRDSAAGDARAPAPSADPEPAAATAVADPRPIDIDDVVLAWGQVVPSLKPATKSAVQEAQPIRLDDDVVVFGIAPGLLDAAKPRFRKVADQIRDALSASLGRRLKFKLVADDSFVGVGRSGSGQGRAGAGAGRTRGEPEPPPPPTDDEIDLADLAETRPADPAVDSVSRLQQAFGASIVEERPRD